MRSIIRHHIAIRIDMRKVIKVVAKHRLKAQVLQEASRLLHNPYGCLASPPQGAFPAAEWKASQLSDRLGGSTACWVPASDTPKTSVNCGQGPGLRYRVQSSQRRMKVSDVEVDKGSTRK